MALEITVLEGADVFANAFNAVATFTGNAEWSSLMKIAEIIGILAAAIAYIKGHELKTFFMWILVFVGINAILLTPKERVVVTDLVQPEKVRTVDNVPIGLALPLYLTTSIGNSIASTYDTFFAQPDDVQYTRTGYLFGQRLLEESIPPSLSYLSPTTRANLDNFIENCQINRSLISNVKFIEEIKNSDNLIEYFKNSNTADMVTYTTASGAKSFLTCKDAGNQLYAEFNNTGNNGFNAFLSDIKQQMGMSSSLTESAIASKLTNVESFFMGLSKGSSKTYVQNMIAGAYRSSFNDFAAKSDNTAIAVAVSAEKQLTGMKLQHQQSILIAGKVLPALHSVMLALMIGIFPIIVLAMFIRELTWNVIKNYFNILFSLMMWAPLFAVLNSIVNVLAMNSLKDYGGLTVSNLNNVQDNLSTMAGMASWFSLMIPFISFRLVTNLGQSIASLGSSLGNALASGSVGAAAASVAAGNYNWGNMQMNNINGNKVDLNQVFRAGMSTTQLANGATQTITQDGSTVYDGAEANSRNLPFNINFGKMLDSSIISAVQSVHRQSEQYQQGYRTSTTKAHDTATQILQNYSHDEMRRSGMTEDEIRSVSKVAAETNAATTRNANVDSIKRDDSTSTTYSMSGGLSGNLSVGKGKGGFGASAGGSAGYNVSDSEQDSVTKSKSASFDYTHNKNWNNSDEARKVSQFNEQTTSHIGDSNLRSLIMTLGDSTRTANESFSGFTASQSREKALSEAANLTESQRLNMQHNLEQEFVRYAEQRLGREQAGLILTTGSAEARHQREALLSEFSSDLEQSLRNIHDSNADRLLGGSQSALVSGNSSYNSPNRLVEQVSQSGSSKLVEQANEMGIKTNGIQQIDKYNDRNTNVRTAYAIKSGRNQVMINEAEDSANNQRKANEKRYEKKGGS